ncbi:hypothetical protein ACIQM0_38925, partial [Streptomyces sp. NPDC091387]
ERPGQARHATGSREDHHPCARDTSVAQATALTEDLEVRLASVADLDKAAPMLRRAFEAA